MCRDTDKIASNSEDNRGVREFSPIKNSIPDLEVARAGSICRKIVWHSNERINQPLLINQRASLLLNQLQKFYSKN